MRLSVESGIVSLRPLYEHVRTARSLEALDGRSAAARRYSQAVGLVVAAIPASQGFYLWGRYESNRLWRNIYLGKAGFGKTAQLRARIGEELRDERNFLYRCILTEEVLLTSHRAIYGDRYLSGWRRVMQKVGTSHIVWATDPLLSNDEVRTIESDLIETLNPMANMQRPIPPESLQQHTHDIVAAFRTAIHAARQDHYSISLAK
jgi:hypothetical protein